MIHVKKLVNFPKILGLIHYRDWLPGWLRIHATLPFDEKEWLRAVSSAAALVRLIPVSLSQNAALVARTDRILDSEHRLLEEAVA